MKRKIYLITIFKTNNIGAMLQAFALHTKLAEYGNVSLVDIKNKHIDKGIKLIRTGITFKSILSSGKDVLRIKSRGKVISKFKLFLNRFKTITLKDLTQVNNEDAYYFTGSDQIWNPNCISSKRKIDERYFFKNIVSNNINAYASSKGSYDYSDNEQEVFFKLLSNFKNISVRESDFSKYLIQNGFPETKHVLDPSLLLNKNEWLDLNFSLSPSISKRLPEKFILVYTIPRTKILNDLILIIKKTLNLPIVIIDQNFTTFKHADIKLKAAGPEDFINLVNSSEFIITDSFHGTCFAINFNKNFITADIGHLSNRVKSLLKLVKLEDRLVNKKSVTKFQKKENLNIDFYNINKLIEMERLKCKKYINDCFK